MTGVLIHLRDKENVLKNIYRYEIKFPVDFISNNKTKQKVEGKGSRSASTH